MLFKDLLFLSFTSSLVAATTKTHDQSFTPDISLRVSEKTVQQACIPARPIVVINGTSPGPVLRIGTERTYWIRVYNDMKDKNTTMHWHGLTMGTAPFSDGTPAVSQWPIPPGHFFDYELRVPSDMAGTYFYHSHVGFQAVSASGPLIVEPRRKRYPFEFDEERVFFIQDIFKKNDSTIEKGLVASPLQWSGESEMILVNGKGGGSANGTFCNSTLATIDVKRNQTYFVRFVGGTALTAASLMLEDHEFEVVEVDGFYVKNYRTPLLQIAGGQRFGVLLHSKNQTSKSQYHFQLESRDRPTVTRSFAVLNYDLQKGNQTFYPTNSSLITIPEVELDFLEYKLQPRQVSQYSDFPRLSDVTRTVKIVAHQKVDGATTWINNNISWFESIPYEPYLVSLYKNNKTNFPDYDRAIKNHGVDPVTKLFPAKVGDVIDIVIQNTGADKGGLDSHPWHAHGEHYWDLGSGNGTYNATANEAKWANSTGHPVKRDTTMLYRYTKQTNNGTEMGWRAWRLRVTEKNVGVWMVHCHVLQHMLMGMQTVWVMGDYDTLTSEVGYPDVQGYLNFGGSVNGNVTRWPTVMEYFD